MFGGCLFYKLTAIAYLPSHILQTMFPSYSYTVLLISLTFPPYCFPESSPELHDTRHYAYFTDQESSPEMHDTRHYTYFTDQPRWSRSLPMNLTYAFSPENIIHSLSLPDIKGAFRTSFSRWSAVIPVTFIETDDYGFSDIKIGFYAGDHGDSEPFDGELGVLAHSFSPESGMLHLDAAEIWAVDFNKEKSKAAVDLESVATHEIGHVLGLGHSYAREAVMYPSLKPRQRKLDLKVDDIKGVQALYGSNPHFKLSASMEYSVTSSSTSSQALNINTRSSSTWFIIGLTTLLHLFVSSVSSS